MICWERALAGKYERMKGGPEPVAALPPATARGGGECRGATEGVKTGCVCVAV